MKTVSPLFSLCVVASLFALTLALTSTVAHAFDCTKARTKTEKAICSSTELKTLDDDLNKVYKAATATAPKTMAAEMKTAQLKWLRATRELCVDKVECLKTQYATRLAELKANPSSGSATAGSANSTAAPKAVVSAKPAATPVPVIDGITYRVVETSEEKPMTLSLERAEFSGTNQTAVATLNKALATIWGDDKGCEKASFKPGDEAWHTRTLTPSKFNGRVAILVETMDSFCPGQAYPNNFSRDYLIDVSTGNRVEFWERMKPTVQARFLKQISENGSLIHSDEESCKEEYEITSLKERGIAVTVQGRAFALTPSFSHASKACEEPLEVSLGEMKKALAGDAKSIQLLEDFAK